MDVKLISVTPEAEELMAYCARVSSPHQENPKYAKLLRYCIRHGHWSVFEQADMTVEITTSRAIAAQILRHRSFTFQEFSQRYAKVMDFERHRPRRQDEKNRQSSHDDLELAVHKWWYSQEDRVMAVAQQVYHEALKQGIAKECARMILPLCTQTKLYMKGNVRSWLTYLMVRLEQGTQLEHREIAQEVWKLFQNQFPTVAIATAQEYSIFEGQ